MTKRSDSLGTFEVLEKGNDFARFKGIFAKPGVLDYSGNGELIPKEELFKEETLKSFRGVPLVRVDSNNRHPSMVTSENFKEYIIGSIGDNVRVENDVVVGEFTVYDKNAIEQIESGIAKDLSIHRICDIDTKSGVYEGKTYNAIQRNLKANHIALTTKGRNKGAIITGRADSNVFGSTTLTERENTERENTGERIMIYRADSDGKDHEIPEAVGKDIEDQKAKLKESQEGIKALKKEKDELEAKLKSYKEKKDTNEAIEKLQKELEEKANLLSVKENEAKTYKQKLEDVQKAEPAKIEQAAKERSTLEGQAKAVLGDSVSVDGLTNSQIKDQIIAKVLPYPEGVRADSITEVVRDAQYQAAIQYSNKVANLQQGKPRSDSDKTIDDLKQARLNLYKGGK